MSQIVEAKVPDIGDFHDVPVIDVCVAAGDRVAIDDALVTLESDKATMDVPSSAAGVVREVRVRVGDKVSEGSVIALIEVAAQGAESAAPVPDAAHAPESGAAPAAPEQGGSAFSGQADLECEMLVLGAGPGGYSAAFRSADLGMRTVLVERYPTLGGVCLNVGCIPSKALLHVAAVLEEAQHLAECGVSFASPGVDLDRLRAHKDKVVGKLTGGLAGMARGRKVEVVQGVGRFVDANHLEVTLPAGGTTLIRFAKAIIAAGSQPVALPFMPDDPRVVDSTGALELRQIPKRMLVIGGGIIGLEMATVYSALGARITVAELADRLMLGADRDLVKVWEKKNAQRFERVLLNTGVVAASAGDEGIEVSYGSGEKDCFDLVLVAVGRTPNGRRIGAESAGVVVDERGFIRVDRQMRTSVPHIFAIGDLVGQPMLAHKAVHEAHVAAEAANGSKRCFDALQIPSVAYTDPEVAWAGRTEDQCRAEGIRFGKSVFPWAASGRALANGRDEGFTKLIFDEETHRVIGGGIVGTHAGDLIGEVCLAIEMGCDAADIGHTIHPHPTLGESIGLAAEVYEGVCTDLPAAKRK
ncbi:dihydrolipoyl dehydrogenase [Accumulibacter sp.]|uniref:dihydrolipoyl dehydrogenase n=1 Tax=Accumulibacter sp. TaxID=2053492 RepID=UPI0025D846E3|nr:dihydrolipoyl dehydrogenase [Accumulibacter sp.]MCM8594088.1 dihydrolipoyl dehydrogenase [Accumulibacter sp.]MCM8624497.1 dihydrolipoyl dehydrogenase [Accumulibacter sp.]MDS4048232.1 dihydrolipoyl dehydrogenase [Accumulibacter sp.]